MKRGLQFRVFFIWVLLSSGEGYAEVTWQSSLELGSQTAAFFRHFGTVESISRFRLYVEPAIRMTLAFVEESDSPGEVGASLHVRGMGDPRNLSHNTPFEYQLLDASVRVTRGWFRGDFGFQQVGWGETFGLFIADLVNPRDLRDPLFNEIGWVRVGQAAVNLQALLEHVSIQLLYVPVPMDPRLPEAGSPFDPLSQSRQGAELARAGFDAFDAARPWEWAEGGGRIVGRVPTGLDLSAFYWSHWARTPPFALRASSRPEGGIEAAPQRLRVHGFGFGAAQDFGSGVVGRLDSVVHLDQPAAELIPLGAQARRYTQFQFIGGLDYTSEHEWMAGLQYHFQNDLPGGGRHWASVRASKSLLERRLELQAFVFAGLGNSDLWFQPQVSVHPTDRLSVSLRADLAGAVGSAALGLLPREVELSRLLLWMSFRI